MDRKEYVETFDHGPGGWLGWSGVGSPARLELNPGAIISRGPWFVDANHAPPGAGYLHLLFVLFTVRALAERENIREAAGANGFVEGGFSTDLRNVQLTVRIRGDVKLRGAQLVLLAQANVSKDKDRPSWINQVLSSQPVRITPEWSEQTLLLAPDQKQWTELGGRHDAIGFYSRGPIEEVLRDLNGDLIFVLFPLDVVPLKPLEGDPHRLRAGFDYEVDRTRLPDGHVMLDEVRIRYP